MEANNEKLDPPSPVEQSSSPIQRPCTQEEINAACRFQSEKRSTIYQTCKEYYLNCSVRSTVLTIFPVLQWLPEYDYKTNITSDLASGFTVAVLHIPQGLAYGALGAVNPIVGVYMAIFPIFVYFLMGTSRHVSMGSFSVTCLMAAHPVITHSSAANASKSDNDTIYTPIQVGSVICFTAGVFQVIFGVCRVGSLSVFLSEAIVSGFTTGAAVLVLVSQLQHVFGLKLPLCSEIFDVICTIRHLANNISETNFVAILISFCVSAIMFTYYNVIKPKVKCKCLFPIELLLIMVSTTISYLFNFHKDLSVEIVGSIPIGIVAPSIPPMKLIPKIVLNSLVIAIVSFAISISMATILARKENYKVDPNQELLAYGFGNIFGGFFSCLPIATSLSRSMLQYLSGGKTQMSSFISSILLLSVILFLGKFLEPLPYSALAGIVISCLQKMIMQITDFPKIWKQSSIDGILWLTTFCSVVILGIEIALAVSLSMALLSIIIENHRVQVRLLGRVPQVDIFLEMNRYQDAKQVPGFIIVKIFGNLHFANIHVVKNKVQCLINETIKEDLSESFTLIIDLSAVASIDPGGLQELNVLIEDVKRLNVEVYFTQCSPRVYDRMKNCDFFHKFPENRFFPTIEDAVSSISNNNGTGPTK